MSAMLKRSKDRKVANAVSPNGKTPTISNTFGLPAGKQYSALVLLVFAKVSAMLVS
jgi:hypothetical protein